MQAQSWPGLGVFAHTFVFIRCFPLQTTQEAKGCYEIRGKTLGIIGYGRVGSQLSVLAESLGAKVIFYGTLMMMMTMVLDLTWVMS